MSAPFGHFRPGEAGFMAPVERPSASAYARLVLALGGVSLVPVLAVVGSFAWFHHADHRCARPVPVVLRGTLAPEADLAKLEMPEDRP